MGTDVADRRWPWLRLRRGNPPWIRYPSVEWEPHAGYTPRLELLHSSGTRGGTATLPSTAGIQPAVSIETGPVEPRGALDGRVTDASGRGLRAVVVLLPTGAETADENRPPCFAERTTGADGRFRFEGLPVGRRDAVVHAPNRPVRHCAFDVVAGEQRIEDVVLEGDGLPHTKLSLDFWASEAMTGRYASRLRLVETGPYARAWLDFDGYRTPSDRVLSHHQLPRGEFEHLGIGWETAPRWTPAQVLLQSQELGPEYEAFRLEETPTDDLVAVGFEVVDGTREVPLDYWRVSFGPGGAMDHAADAHPHTRFRMAPGTPLAWTVWAPGYAPVRGTEADLVERDGERIAAVALQPGWGALLYFRAGNPGTFLENAGPWGEPWHSGRFPTWSRGLGAWAAPPLANVRVDVEGEAVARSDAEGCALFALPTRPERLSIVSPGWRIAGIEPVSFREEGDLRHRHIVWMERE